MNSLTAPLTIEEIDNQGVFTGYASVFGVVDDHNDVILPGAFRQSLENYERANSYPKLLWQHNYNQPIGIWEFIDEDDHGLYVEGRLILEVQQAKEAYALLRNKAIDGLSIGYRVVESHKGSNTNTRMITKIDLLEASIVTFPANQLAKIEVVR